MPAINTDLLMVTLRNSVGRRVNFGSVIYILICNAVCNQVPWLCRYYQVHGLLKNA